MNNKALGRLAICAAPFLFIDFMVNDAGKGQPVSTSLTGLFDFIYITGWMAAIAGLYRIKAAGHKWWGKAILVLQLLLLFLADAWNIYEFIAPGSGSALYLFLDKFWPISNIFMLITGIAVVSSARISGIGRIIPLLAGLWFPLTVLPVMIFHLSYQLYILSGIYSCITWALMGNLVRTSSETYEIKISLA